MSHTPLSDIYSIMAEAHAHIQQEFSNIDPVVSVNTKMRDNGIPADAMTIDCLKSSKRIILIFHDHQPELVLYQFGYRDKDPAEEFEQIALQNVTEKQLYHWMKAYFSAA